MSPVKPGMEEQQRRKRAKATTPELPETSSSRAPNGELRKLSGSVDAPRVLQNDGSAELGPLSPRNTSISMPVFVCAEACEGTVQRSPMHAVVEACGVANTYNVNSTLEEPGQPSLDLSIVTDILPLRDSHITGVDEDEESPQEPDLGSNLPPPGAAADDNEDAPVEAQLSTLLPRDLAAVAEEEQREASTEPVSIEVVLVETEVLIETARSLPVGTSIGITEGAHSCTGDRTIGLKSSSIAAEEALGDRADGMNCPICMEPWTGEGIHRICCLACGHLFGRSCIRRWLNQKGKRNSKCPHCNRKARIEDIRNLYVPSLTVIDDKNQQLLEELGVLKSKNQDLVVQNEKLRKDYEHLQAVLAASHPRDMSRSKDSFFMKRSYNSQQECSRREPYIESRTKRRNYVQAYGMDAHTLQKATNVNGNKSLGQFQLQEEFSLPGARVFDMDAYSQMLLVAQKSTAANGVFNLNKISLLSLSDTLMMPLPPCTGAVRDIRVAPPGGKLPGRLALVASLGKMISLFSLESNNVVLTYKLQSPCWSCAWDLDEPNYVFAGLQDGALTIFDLRQTSSPLRSLQSFGRQPIHTLHPVNECSSPQGVKRTGVLSACSSGVRFWDSSMLSLYDSRPHAIACPDNPGVCVGLAYNHFANVAVATFREKPSLHQPGSMNHACEAASMEPSSISSQPNTQLNSIFHPLRASHYPLLKSASTSPLGSECEIRDSALQREDSSSINCGWKYGNPMFGNVSPVGMHRSAIVSSSGTETSSDFQSVFAFGDEETHSLMLWDVKTLTVIDRLRALCSPILDVKSMYVGEHAILGCISTTKLQVYKR